MDLSLGVMKRIVGCCRCVKTASSADHVLNVGGLLGCRN